MSHELSLAIIGLGSRGLSVLERIVTTARRAGPTGGPIRVEVVDPTCTGAGVHRATQPDYLLLNTTCENVSMFPDASTVGAEVDMPGPSLYEWATERGLGIGRDGYTVGDRGRPIRPHDFLPRRLLGEYLGWFRDQVLRRAHGHVDVRLHRTEAIDMSLDDTGALVVELADGDRVAVDHAFLTTGYTPNRPVSGHAPRDHVRTRRGHQVSRLVAEPYPLPDRVAAIAPGQVTAINGFGLSAMDVISSLTVGRDGEFTGTGARLRYRPSGREPALLLYSRSGAPCRARPQGVAFGPRYRPVVLTPEHIDAVRSGRSGPLDFDEDVLPLVLTEMRIGYRLCEARCAGADEGALRRELAGAGGLAGTVGVLDSLDRHLGPFDAAAAFDGAPEMLLSDSSAYRKWFVEFVRTDLADGLLGFSRSPVKAALDILRDLRDTFRYVVDFGGLTDSSLDAFHRRTVPALNRAVVGPQYERHAELLALMDAGLLDVPFGPAPTTRWDDHHGRWTITSTQLAASHARDADWLVMAQVPLPAVDASASELVTALHRKGWIRPHRPGSRYISGIDIDPDQHPIDVQGEPVRQLSVLGVLCEGATFYNNLVPSPHVYSRPVHDAHRCVAATLASRSRAP